MAQRALRIPLHKKFDGVLFRDLKEPADMKSCSDKVLQRRNASKGTYCKLPIAVHHIEINNIEDVESEQDKAEVASCKMMNPKAPIVCKTLVKSIRE
ncbi:unnamed protein product [Prunus armeniaca]